MIPKQRQATLSKLNIPPIHLRCSYRPHALQGIQVLVDALEMATHANTSHELLGEYTAAVLNAIWDCIVKNRRNLAHLLADDGLGDLLDAIEACHAAIQPLALAILAGLTWCHFRDVHLQKHVSCIARVVSLATPGALILEYVLSVFHSAANRMTGGSMSSSILGRMAGT